MSTIKTLDKVTMDALLKEIRELRDKERIIEDCILSRRVRLALMACPHTPGQVFTFTERNGYGCSATHRKGRCFLEAIETYDHKPYYAMRLRRIKADGTKSSRLVERWQTVEDFKPALDGEGKPEMYNEK